MSYYTIAIEFWAALGLSLGLLPLVAVTARGVMGTVARSFPSLTNHAPVHSTRTGPASC